MIKNVFYNEHAKKIQKEKGGKLFDINLDWFLSMMKKIGQIN